MFFNYIVTFNISNHVITMDFNSFNQIINYVIYMDFNSFNQIINHVMDFNQIIIY